MQSRRDEIAPTRSSESDAALSTIRAAAGAVHRLAWLGEDPHGDRRRALGWFRNGVIALSMTRPALAAVLDWWLVAALGEDPVELAWSIDREIPGEVGSVLRALLAADTARRLDVVRRPAAFQATIEQLEQASERNPGKIAADKQILTEAIGECRAVIRAAQTDSPAPRNLRLAEASDADLEAWASEGPGSRRVVPNTPVWDHLVKQLATRRDLIKRALSLWPGEVQSAPELPGGWRTVVSAACGEGSDIACALVEDAVPEPGERPILGAATILEAARTLPELEALTRWFVLAREAAGTEEEELPPWAGPLQERLAELSASIAERSGTYAGDAAAALEEARQLLADIEPDEAEAWISQADEMHNETTADMTLERVRQRAAARAEQLRLLGQAPPPETDATTAWAVAVDLLWSDQRQRLREEGEETSALASLLRGGQSAIEAVEIARREANREDLPGARRSLDRAAELLRPLIDAERERLGPELWGLHERLRSLDPSDRRALAVGIDRAAARRAAGLDAEVLVRDLRVLVEQLGLRGSVATICVEDRGGERRRLAYVLGGLDAEGAEPRPASEVRGVLATRGLPEDAPARVAAWGEVVSRPGGGPPGRVYLKARGAVAGPYREVGGKLAPEHPAMAVGALPQSEFERLFGRVQVGDRWLVPLPPSLEEVLRAEGEAEDLLSDGDLARWLAEQLEGAPPADALERWITDRAAVLPSPLREARLGRLEPMLARATELASARERAVRAWLATPEGDAAVVRAAESLVDREAEPFRRSLERQRAEIAAAEADLAGARERLAEETKQARADLDRVREDIAAAESLLGDRKLRLLAELGGFGAAGAAPAPVVATGDAPPLRASTFVPTPFPGLASLVQQIAGATWDVHEVANLLLSLATGRWTLLAGLPGVGKSTFVRSVLTRIGHGACTERCLELVVRRDWQDDAALFGFWHPTNQLWSGSSEGFVEHLLRAADGRGGDGMWPVVVEELNLASPEYYLARMLSALEAAEPTVRLYDPELAPANAGRYPAAFRVPSSVRLVGTVNVDDTVERLSPRFLSRASVVWIEPRSDAPSWRPEDDATDLRVPWSALEELGAAEQTDLGPIGELVRFLRDERVPGAPTVRTHRAIGRYLAAARGVLPADDAQDLQVLQRVLPPLRGVGPRWRRLLDRLVELMERHGWRRSAARTRELRERGEDLGDWYDFFHT